MNRDELLRDDVLSLLRDIATELKRRRDQGLTAIEHAGSAGLVTDADLWAQDALVEGLSRLLPPTEVVAEENGLRAGQVDAHPGSCTWIIDPVDGTANYARHAAEWGTQVALCRGGRLVGGWIVCPDKGWEIAACEGAPLSATGADERPVPRSIIAAQGDFEPSHRRKLARSELAIRSDDASCAIDYSKFAFGQVSAAVYRRTYLWDHLPGLYIATRMGAVATRWGGEAFDCTVDGEGILVRAVDTPAGVGDTLLPDAV